jgi:hypothetical protein
MLFAAAFPLEVDLLHGQLLHSLEVELLHLKPDILVDSVCNFSEHSVNSLMHILKMTENSVRIHLKPDVLVD